MAHFNLQIARDEKEKEKKNKKTVSTACWTCKSKRARNAGTSIVALLSVSVLLEIRRSDEVIAVGLIHFS